MAGLASTNPSQRDFYRNGRHMRFRAWKMNYVFYWSMGAEIETWGRDFGTARIESRYLDTVAGACCHAVKLDSEFGQQGRLPRRVRAGGQRAEPLRVVSNCGALWQDQTFGGQVEAGTACSEV